MPRLAPGSIRRNCRAARPSIGRTSST